MDVHLTPTLLGRLGGVNLKSKRRFGLFVQCPSWKQKFFLTTNFNEGANTGSRICPCNKNYCIFFESIFLTRQANMISK